MTLVLLATCALHPGGDGPGLLPALAERGLDARWARWDDPDVDWAAADLVLVRSTWDYHRRVADFLAWADHVAVQTTLLNRPATLRWNSDKRYLLELGSHVPVVPTELLDEESLVPGLSDALARWPTVVVKPRVGASGVGVLVADSLTDPRLEGLVTGPWVVQPLVGSIRTEGETSVYVMAGRAVSQIVKRPSGGEIRIHREYGGSATATAPAPEEVDLAESAVAAAAALLGDPPTYARVDLVRHDGRLVVSELELVEPGLALADCPDNAGHLADAVAFALAGGEC